MHYVCNIGKVLMVLERIHFLVYQIIYLCIGTSIKNVQFLGKYVGKLGFQESDLPKTHFSIGFKSGKSYAYLLQSKPKGIN